MRHIVGRELFKLYPVFRNSILELDKISEPLWGYSFMQRTGLFDDAKNAEFLPDIWLATVIFPSMTMIQIALVDLLASVGIKPDIIIGHSAG